jgi:DNA modification methylase
MLMVYDVTTGIPLPDESADVIITSPPYYGLRSYGDNPSELGAGQSLDEYIAGLRGVLSECRRILRPTGLLWLVIGDTASGSGGAGGDYRAGGRRAGRRMWRQGDTGLPAGTWCAVPARVAVAAIDDGWLLRSEIIWAKGVERPESLSHVRRPRPAHETILLLAKSREYRWRWEALVESGTVWHVAPSRGAAGHPAPFPPELVRRCLQASGVGVGDVVVDPFAGSGTTLEVAREFGADAIGFDVYDWRSDDGAVFAGVVGGRG